MSSLKLRRSPRHLALAPVLAGLMAASGLALADAGVAVTAAASVADDARVALAPAAMLPTSETAVGQVSLVIGDAQVLRRDGRSETLRRGAPIVVGDRVQTGSNGHVHVRFIDNGVVSVRPQSVLQVQSYHYDARNPAVNEVRLRLEQGATRSISGAATEVDKSRFRLNTPIAAIGVRGTDFIVRSDDRGVQATVADGAIVVSPLSGECLAGALGPCAGDAVQVLSAGMGHLVAEVRPGEGRTRLVPAANTLLAASPGKADEGAHARAQGEPLTYAVNDRAAADLLTIAKVALSDPDPNRPSDLSAQMVWGRWGTVADPVDRVGVPESLAMQGRHYTGIGDSQLGLYLYRADQTRPGGLFPNDLSATVDFRLTRGSASFERGGLVEGARIDGHTLRIDFARRTFATGLELSSPSGGAAVLRAAGQVNSNGSFAVRDAEQVVAGAIAVDGREAGYLFERSAAGGLFKGRTLWGAEGGY
ncbi:MAG: FecR domain-containing protein [Burkholderiales bacterium]|nr:FecR domain-containing protein [Burkholderiales bacterium]